MAPDTRVEFKVVQHSLLKAAMILSLANNTQLASGIDYPRRVQRSCIIQIVRFCSRSFLHGQESG